MSNRIRVAAASITGLLGAACGNGDASPTGLSGGAFAAAGKGLCRAAAVADQPEAAGRISYDRVHQGLLHELADDTATRDRAVAAALLEAKQAVEAALDAGDSFLPQAFEELVTHTDAALRVLDHHGLACADQP